MTLIEISYKPPKKANFNWLHHHSLVLKKFYTGLVWFHVSWISNGHTVSSLKIRWCLCKTYKVNAHFTDYEWEVFLQACGPWRKVARKFSLLGTKMRGWGGELPLSPTSWMLAKLHSCKHVEANILSQKHLHSECALTQCSSAHAWLTQLYDWHSIALWLT